MTVKQMWEQMKEQSPVATLIDPTLDKDYLTDYKTSPAEIDAYYMGIKYAGLETVTDDLESFLAMVDLAILNNDYKWTKLYNTTLLEYDPIANVDAEIQETRDIDKRHHEEKYGAGKVTTKNGQAPMDSSAYANQSQSITDSDQKTDEHDEDAYKDVITTTRKGNIGVTSTQSLILEQRSVVDFHFLDILMADIINMLTYPYYSEV